MSARKAIPVKLERDLMIESGYACALCRAIDPLEIEHIEEYAKVREHSFENMIVLCANCHRRKKNGSSPRHINKKSLTQLKSKLMLINGRYTDLEKRFLQECQNVIAKDRSLNPQILIHHTMWLQIKYLIDDGYANAQKISGGMTVTHGNGLSLNNDQILVTLTQPGKDFVLTLLNAREGSSNASE